MPHRRRAAILLLAGLLALAGCTRPALKRTEYRSRVTAICDDARRAEIAIPIPASAGEVVPALRHLRAINRRLTNRIAALNPPLGSDRGHDTAVGIGIATDRSLGRLIVALKRSPDLKQELNRRRPALQLAAARDDHRWAQLHLKGCAGGPSGAIAALPAPRA